MFWEDCIGEIMSGGVTVIVRTTTDEIATVTEIVTESAIGTAMKNVIANVLMTIVMRSGKRVIRILYRVMHLI